MSEHNHEHHVSSAGQLWAIGIALTILTILTVGLSYVEIPAPFDVITALTIAFGKAFLVAAFFMNLYWDTKFNSMLLIGAFVFFFLMVGVTLLDTLYRNDVIPSF
ncbi:MAG: cytochrome C oxidase subunit IV family protein [Balneola sp.]